MTFRAVKVTAALTAAAAVVAGGILLERGCRHHGDEDLAKEKLPDRTRVLSHDDPIVQQKEAAYIAEALRHPRPLIYGGLPESVHRLTILTNIGYIAGYDEQRHESLYVAYRLSRFGKIGENVVSGSRAGLRFQADDRLQDPIPGSFLAKSGYDNGHMAPSDAIFVCFGRKAQEQTFRMPNVIAQKRVMNEVVWREIERLEENFYANACKEIWIIDGPVFGPNDEVIRKGKHSMEVPEACFKIWIDEDRNRIRILVFIVPQDVKKTDSENVARFLVSLGEARRRTQLKFFPDLPDACRQALESLQATNLWKLEWEK